MEYHLECDNHGHFTPVFEWHRPRPQYLLVVALQAAEVSMHYIAWLGFQELEELTESLAEVQERILTLDYAHEQWLNQQA